MNSGSLNKFNSVTIYLFAKSMLTESYERLKADELVKSQKSRRSRGGGSPELLDLAGFPLSRE
jgi:hypothetical protein